MDDKLKKLEEIEKEIEEYFRFPFEEELSDLKKIIYWVVSTLKNAWQKNAIYEEEIQYFIDRVEQQYKHPDGPIRSTKTYNRYKQALQKAKDEEKDE